MFRALFMALLLAGLVVTPAAAATPADLYQRVARAADPQAAYEALSATQKRKVRAFVSADRVEHLDYNIEQAQQAVNCWTHGRRVVAYNNVGWQLWSWNVRVDWCGDGARIVDHSVRRWGETYVAFYSWKEVQFEKKLSIFAVPQKLTAFAQAEVKACFFSNIGCVYFYYPWIEAYAWANGNRSSIGKW